MSVRITGGAFAGRRIFGPVRVGPEAARGRSGAGGLRPTAARLRKSLFTVLAEELPGSRVLDLCAGVGTLGFEALSRGARHCVFVERALRMRRRIERNAERLGVDSLRILAGEAAKLLPQLENAGAEFGIVFFDPPWDDWEGGAAARLLAAATRLGPQTVAAEHRSSRALPPRLEPAPPLRADGRDAAVRFVRTRTIVAGDGAFSLYGPETGTREAPTPTS